MGVRKLGATVQQCSSGPNHLPDPAPARCIFSRNQQQFAVQEPAALGAEQQVERRGEGLRDDHQLRVRHSNLIFLIYNSSSL